MASSLMLRTARLIRLTRLWPAPSVMTIGDDGCACYEATRRRNNKTCGGHWDLPASRSISFSNILHGPDSSSIPCWKCGVVVDLNSNKLLFCDSCAVVQKPTEDSDYFTVLGLTRTFDINPKELTKRFRLMQMQLHPDRFTLKSKDEKEISAVYSSLLNQAYKVLQSPVERGIYLLELETGDGLREGGINSAGGEFLIEIMEVNEALDEARNQSDIQQISNTNQAKLDDLIKKTAKCFREKDWDSARDCLQRLKYYAQIQNKIKELEEKTGPT